MDAPRAEGLPLSTAQGPQEGAALPQAPVAPPPESLDPNAFRRVWQRVMPEDRVDCPFTLDPPAPAQTCLVPRQEDPTHYPLPPSGANVPIPPAKAPGFSAVEGCGGPAFASLCLGEASRGELAGLDQAAQLVSQGLCAYGALSRRWGRAASLAAEKREQLGRLLAARYLISGENWAPQGAAAPRKGSSPAPRAPLAALLRDRFHAEQALVLRLLTAANGAADPCLKELYRELAVETQGVADRLRGWLEQRMA